MGTSLRHYERKSKITNPCEPKQFNIELAKTIRLKSELASMYASVSVLVGGSAKRSQNGSAETRSARKTRAGMEMGMGWHMLNECFSLRTRVSMLAKGASTNHAYHYITEACSHRARARHKMSSRLTASNMSRE